MVILHLSPQHESRLAEVLQSACAIPVTQVVARTRIEPNHVYVIPPDRGLDIVDGTLNPIEVAPEQRRAPIDMFFRALANSHGSRAVCIVLSGTGPNGSVGLKRVKEYGGLVLAQEPSEAEYGDMPRNAIATGLVDLVLPVGEMPARMVARVLRQRGQRAHVHPALDAPLQPCGSRPRRRGLLTRNPSGRTGSDHRRTTGTAAVRD